MSAVRSIEFTAAYDKRSADPAKNFGIHGCNLIFRFGDDERGVVQFLLFTNWQLPEVTSGETDCVPIGGDPHWRQRPLPADLGYHSPVATYEGQRKMEKCGCLKQGFCFYDGSGLNADPVFERLLREGSDGVWKALEEYHLELFGEAAR